jgi:hypothetical protein
MSTAFPSAPWLLIAAVSVGLYACSEGSGSEIDPLEAVASVIMDPVEPTVPPANAVLTAEITNNEVRDHRRLAVGTGIRIGAVGLGTPYVHGTSHVTIRDNLLVNDNFAMMVEGRFRRRARGATST